MGVFNEAAIERAVKKNGEHLAALVSAQLRTNEWLAHIASLLEAQQQGSHVMASGPWPPVQR